jgi:hypothetical protein
MNLPVLNIPDDFADARLRLHHRADGTSVLLYEHAHYPRAIFFDEKSAIWRELTRHVSEL